MDLFSGLGLFLNGLFASTLIALNLFLGSASSLVSSYFPTTPPQTTVVRETPTKPTTVATSSTKTTAAATSTPKKPDVKVVAKKITPAASSTSTTQTTKVALAPIIDPELVNTTARASIVNILCIAAVGGSVRSISGSGVIVDARGVVLTNAHIAQYFLLKDYPTKNSVDCTIRTGSPAQPMYRASLLYLPPAWINENASQITAEHGLGTGENDYAFLLITSTTNPAGTLPSSFTNIAMSGAMPDTGDGALVAGYPAGFLDGITIEKNLYATSAFTTIGQLYTFNTSSNVDVVSLGGTVVSQGGSSGGAVVRTYDGKLIGLIATATTGDTTASRDLRAITISYINRSLAAAGKNGLAEFLSLDLKAEAAAFLSKTFVEERQKLVDALTPAR